ncbi:MAG: sugar phosphate isomerase/epimerase [Planctomycetaceae bacterium]|nr:sugar phosphate isomerase/epimerase [Planctomycetaceae bacterium]
MLNRRTLLTRSLQAAGVAAASNPLGCLFASPKSRGFKIGACDWSLGKPSDPAALDVAKRIGLDGVQIGMGSLANEMHLRRADVQAKYREAVRRTGLEIASLGITEMNNVPLKSDVRAAKWLAQSVDICRALGLKLVLIPQFCAGDLDMRKTVEIDRLVNVLRDSAPAAEKEGVAFGLENYLSAEDNMRIIERVGSPAVMVYYDVGNSTDKGRDVCKEIRTLGKLICELHFKDAGYPLGHGRIDFGKVRKAIDDVGYRGWIHLESAAPRGVVSDYTAQCKFVRSLFPRAG